MNQIRKELQNPEKYQPEEKFLRYTKYALIVCNQYYNKKYVTLGDLDAVVDDYKNAKHTAKLMGIPLENIIEIKNARFDELNKVNDWLKKRFTVLTKPLKSTTGFYGTGILLNGFLWETLRPFAMNLVAPFDSITIDLNENEQKVLEDLINLQESIGDPKKSIGKENEDKKICNIQWKKLKPIVMTNERNSKILKIPLDEHQ